MDFDHDDLADDSGKAPISWDMVALYKDEIYMKRNSESSCWDECDGRTFLNGEFYDNMSDELRAIVKPVLSEYPDIKVVRRGDDWAEYSLPKKWIKVGFPRQLSDEQRAEMANRMKAARDGINAD